MKLGVEAALVDGLLIKGDVEVQDGRISAVGLSAPAGRGIAVPGFVDLQVNGFGGVDFLDADADGYRRAGEALLETGVTAYLPTLITSPEQQILAAMREVPISDARPRILGLHLEGPFLSPNRLGTHEASSRRDPDPALLDRLLDAGPVRMMTLAPELPGATQLIDRLLERGVAVSLGHTDATAEQANAAFDRGARSVTHLYNAMSQLGHRQPGLVGAALADRNVMCGLIADGHHVHETAARAAFNARGADGVALISDAMPPAAGGPRVFHIEGRRVTQVGTKLTLDDGTLAGAAITLMDAVRYATRTLGIALADALKMATLTPARLLRVDDKIGRLRKGFAADLVHIGDDLAVRGAWIAGNATRSGA